MTVRRVTKPKKATRKKVATTREGHRTGTGRRQVTLDHDPRDFLREIIEEVIFRDGSLEDADLRVAEHFKDRGDREREQMGKQMLPLLSRLVSAAPSLSTMVSSRAQ
jgi:hypothetical protein